MCKSTLLTSTHQILLKIPSALQFLSTEALMEDILLQHFPVKKRINGFINNKSTFSILQTAKQSHTIVLPPPCLL